MFQKMESHFISKSLKAMALLVALTLHHDIGTTWHKRPFLDFRSLPAYKIIEEKGQ